MKLPVVNIDPNNPPSMVLVRMGEIEENLCSRHFSSRIKRQEDGQYLNGHYFFVSALEVAQADAKCHDCHSS